MPDPSYKEIALRFGLEQPPESVTRLTQLVNRQDADLDVIAQTIQADALMTKRLLRAANPRAASEEDYDITSVEEALMRLGLGCALLLAMGTPLQLALIKTFGTMLDQKLEIVDPARIRPPNEEQVLGTIGFSGKAEGKVYLRLSTTGARSIASHILGVKPEEIQSRAEIDDAVGELLNIITGNFKSNLCDAGLDCRLRTPSVTRTQGEHLDACPGAGIERMAFRGPDQVVFVEMTVNPWSAE